MPAAAPEAASNLTFQKAPVAIVELSAIHQELEDEVQLLFARLDVDAGREAANAGLNELPKLEFSCHEVILCDVLNIFLSVWRDSWRFQRVGFAPGVECFIPKVFSAGTGTILRRVAGICLYLVGGSD